MEKFAVIDTETNWNNEAMSIDIVIADGGTKERIASKYYIIIPKYKVGRLFSRKMFDCLGLQKGVGLALCD